MLRILLILCCLTFAGGQEPVAPAPVSANAYDYAAILNGEKITITEFNEAVQNAKNTLTGQNEIDFETEEGKFILATTQRSILDDLINQKIIHQQAQKMGIAVSDAEVKAEIAKLRKGFPSQKLFLETLAEENINEHDLQSGIRERLVVEQIKKDLTKKITISDRDIENFIKQNQALFNQPRRIQFKQIVLASRSEAEDIQVRIKKGEAFSDLVKHYSIDLLNKTNAGNIGFIEEGTLNPEIEKIIFQLKEGELSPIIVTDEGYTIYKCVQILNPEDSDSGKAHEEARKYLLSKKENEIFEKWFQKVKADCKVEINPGLDQEAPAQPKSYAPGNISNGRV